VRAKNLLSGLTAFGWLILSCSTGAEEDQFLVGLVDQLFLPSGVG